MALDPTTGHIQPWWGEELPGNTIQPGHGPAPARFGLQTLCLLGGPGKWLYPNRYNHVSGSRVFHSRDRGCLPPHDYGAEPYHNRPLTLREALTISDNVVSAILNYELSPELGLAYAQRLGIDSTLQPYLSSALGTSEVTPLELTRAFCPLANGGRKVEIIAISKITDAQGRTLLANQPRLRQVVDPAAAYIITDVLKGVLAPGGTAGGIDRKISRPAAGKTGTSQDYGNAWFVGYTPDLVAGVWVGNDKSAQSVGASGASLAAPIWADFIQRGLAGTPRSDFPRPQRVVGLRSAPSRV